VAYHLNLEITDDRYTEVKAICPFCGYNKNSKVATMSLNIMNNKYHCIRCGAGEASNIAISPINDIADIDRRDTVYRDFLSMLKLDLEHKRYLEKQGLLKSSIESQMYKTVPKSYIKRRLVANSLKRKYDLAGISRILSRRRLGLDFCKCKRILCTSF